MYGYLRLTNKEAPAEIRKYYRQEYCTLCHALWKYYGYKPRFLLSYDITFMAALLGLNTQITFQESKPICYFRKDIESDEERWKKLSAISVLLSAEKLRDNINDDNSILARIVIALFSKSIKKAEIDYPALSALLKNGFVEMSRIEKEKGDVYQLASAFSEIMVGSKQLLYGKSEFEDAVLHHVATWIYFIDAIDDLDKDVKDGSYNPFLSIAQSREQLLSEHVEYISEFINKQREALVSHMGGFKVDSIQAMTVLNVLNYSMPAVTRNVLLGKKAYSPVHIHVKYDESKGGIVFA